MKIQSKTHENLNCRSNTTARGCILQEKLHAGNLSERSQAILTDPCASHPIIDSMPDFDANADSIERETILGSQRTNPYTVANMRTAYNNLGYTTITVSATNQYIRFLPNTAQQLSILDSTLDAQNLEMFGAPMDYDVLQEGDYYHDPSIADSMPTWQYAVVPTTFSPPAGITYQLLSQIHIPADNYEAVETEAERLASIQDSINCGGLRRTINPDVQACLPGYHWDKLQNKCVCDCCPSGYYWNTTTQTCVPILPPPPPPGPSPDAQLPAGTLTVSDLTSTPGVRNVLIIAKRWFKVEREYTDNNGNFLFTKHFKHKVKLNVKFKNSYANVQNINLIQPYNMLLPLTDIIGVYSSNKNSISYNFQKYNSSVADKGNRYWAAAVAVNSVQEYRDYATQEHVALPPSGLKIFLTRFFSGGATPMWHKRGDHFIIPREFFLTYMVRQDVVNLLLGIFKDQIDMVIGFNGQANYASYYPDDLKALEYHELTHTGEYFSMGNSWYSTFVSAEIGEIDNTFGSNNSPYGDGSNPNNSPIIALGESWAEHIGQYMVSLRYGMNSTQTVEQGKAFNNGDITGLNSHQVALENYDPHLSSDPFHWIPIGIFYDMMDTRDDETANPRFVIVDDQVSGYTNQQFNNAFNTNTRDMGTYRTNLLSQNNNNQSTQVTTLFQQYGY